ncbi:hypothetical protein like AT5G43690 [Hibiscus trionum]|uniref:Sulfotransferase n=1 Tax=Hibiscus trionum TaxID=183268 RepID=A0A9W7HZ72_HIBTR|nr:hypothetical protein like AT5G43690 [Hibiscus trionum]
MNFVITARGIDSWPMDEAFGSFCQGVHAFRPFHDHVCFLGKPFEKEGEVDKVQWRCSLERLKNLDANRHGVEPWLGIDYKHYFRHGIVGDWKNYFTGEMEQKLDHITTMKFEGSGQGFH